MLNKKVTDGNQKSCIFREIHLLIKNLPVSRIKMIFIFETEFFILEIFINPFSSATKQQDAHDRTRSKR